MQVSQAAAANNALDGASSALCDEPMPAGIHPNATTASPVHPVTANGQKNEGEAGGKQDKCKGQKGSGRKGE